MQMGLENKSHQLSFVPGQTLGQLRAPISGEEDLFILLHTLHQFHRLWTPSHSKLSKTKMASTQEGLHTCRSDMNYTQQTICQGTSTATPPWQHPDQPGYHTNSALGESDECAKTIHSSPKGQPPSLRT